MIRQDIRKILLSPYYYISIAAMAVILYLGCEGDVGPDFLWMYEESCYGGIALRLTPLLVGLAVSDIYCVERKDGYYYSMLVRSDKIRYCYSKILTAMFTGFTAVLSGILLFWVMCQVASGGMPLISGETIEFYQNDPTMLGEMTAEGNSWILLLVRTLLFCMYGMIWPVMSLAVAIFTANRYLVMAVPVIYCQVMSAAAQLLGVNYLDPLVLSGGLSRTTGQMWGNGITYDFGVMFLYLLLCGGIFRRGVERSLQ